MREIFIIGTVHEGMTPHRELEQVLENLRPDQLLVELQAAKSIKEIKTSGMIPYPDELIFAYEWAKERNIPVNGFDVPVSILGDDLQDNEDIDFIERQKALFTKYSWKDLNKKDVLEGLSKIAPDEITDQAKYDEREVGMLNNITKLMVKDGRVIILTGADHLNFFGKHIPHAIFPLRP